MKTLALRSRLPIASSNTDNARWMKKTRPRLTAPEDRRLQAAGIRDYEFSTQELSADGLIGIYKYKKVFMPPSGRRRPDN